MTSSGSVRGSRPDAVAWRRAGACAESSCVEVAGLGGEIGVRDSKRPDVAPLVFSRAEWLAFVDGVRRGDFDDVWRA